MRQILTPWLNTVCGMIPNVRTAAVFLSESESLPVVWPAGSNVNYELASLAETAQQQNTPLFSDKQETNQLLVAFPLVLEQGSPGVLTILLDASSKQQDVVLQLLNWSQSWLGLLADKSKQQPSFNDTNQLIATILKAPKENIPTVLVSLVAEHFGSKRVSLGVSSARGVRIAAMSHQVSFDSKFSQVGLSEAAMEEALAHKQAIVVGKGQESNWTAHQVLLNHIECDQVCSVPLLVGEEKVGVLTLQTESTLSDEMVAEFEALCGLLGSIVALQQAAKPGWFGKTSEKVRSYQSALRTAGLTKARAWSASIVIFVVAIFVVDGEFEVTAKATLEGKTQQAIVTPFDGYIASASVRAGDVVAKDSLLAAMDNKDLQFELKKVEDNIEALTRQYRQALSEMNQSEVRILKSRVDQVEAQKLLLQHRLQQVEFRAPIAGVVLKGDLSRRVGAPVEKGEVLFEIAPLESYQILLLVEEGDIQEIQPGLFGEVVLTSHPNQKIPFQVERIASVMEEDAATGVLFRVEGSIQGEYDFLRPGMGGVAKIGSGERAFAWIMFRDFIHWLQLTSWRWLP